MTEREEYISIINYAKSQNRKKGDGNYYEEHHILPKSLFPRWEKKQSNLVLLTASEHFRAHEFLIKIYPCQEMFCALKFMHDCGKGKVTAEVYEELKKVHAEKTRQRSLGNNYGHRKHSPEEIEHQRQGIINSEKHKKACNTEEYKSKRREVANKTFASKEGREFLRKVHMEPFPFIMKLEHRTTGEVLDFPIYIDMVKHIEKVIGKKTSAGSFEIKKKAEYRTGDSSVIGKRAFGTFFIHFYWNSDGQEYLGKIGFSNKELRSYLEKNYPERNLNKEYVLRI